MSDDEMVSEALRQAQQLGGSAEVFEAASQEPSMPSAPAEEATMPMRVADMFDDEE